MQSDDEQWNRQFRGSAAFEHAYESQPPWDIGRPQRAIRQVADEGRISGRVLDAGCGTGEHALMAAELGLDATGVDIVPSAIEAARQKAAQRGHSVRFEVADVFDLDRLGESFDTVVDSGLFHVLEPRSVHHYVNELESVVTPGALIVLLTFSDRVPGDAGPRRVRQGDISEAFAEGWVVEEIRDASIEVAFGPVDSVHAWLAMIRRSRVRAG